MPTEVFSHKRAEQETERDFWLKPRRLTAWVKNPTACGGLKPFFVTDVTPQDLSGLPVGTRGN